MFVALHMNSMKKYCLAVFYVSTSLPFFSLSHLKDHAQCLTYGNSIYCVWFIWDLGPENNLCCSIDIHYFFSEVTHGPTGRGGDSGSPWQPAKLFSKPMRESGTTKDICHVFLDILTGAVIIDFSFKFLYIQLRMGHKVVSASGVAVE